MADPEKTERNEELYERWQAGESKVELGHAFGLSGGRVTAILLREQRLRELKKLGTKRHSK